MYGEEFMQNSINATNNNRDEGSNINMPINSMVPSVLGLENAINTIRDVEPDQKSKGEKHTSLIFFVVNFKVMNMFGHEILYFNIQGDAFSVINF